MKIFSQQFIAKYQDKLLFIVIWLHVSLLNTLSVSSQGPLFLWHENSQLKTILINAAITITTFVFYLTIKKLLACVNKKSDAV